MQRLKQGWLVILVLNMVSLWAVQLVNDVLGQYTLFVYCGALFIIFPALYLSFCYGLVVAIMMGLLLEAGHTANGLSLLLLATVYIAIASQRGRIRRNSRMPILFAALLANASLILVLSVVYAHELLYSSTYWLRIGVDLLLSELFLAALIMPYLRLQYRVLCAFGIDPTDDNPWPV